jgi:arylsulfatase A-like enzyme
MRCSYLALAAAALPLAAPAWVAADSRPNILICVADDWSYPHAGTYGNQVVKTPNFDKVAAEGVFFTNAYCVAPSCTPSRAAMLTGQWPHRLDEGGNLWGTLPKRFPTYPDQLEAAGYAVGFAGKGWGPGSVPESGRARNPAGPSFRGFDEFLKSVPADKPFCFWYGSRHPHRPYEPGSGQKAGLKPEGVRVPPYLPDTPEVRGDILDYYAAVQQFDRELGEVLNILAASGKAANTLLFVTSDNGWPFPRCKANLYDGGTRMPLAVRWPAQVNRGGRIDSFVSHIDLAPTILDAAGLRPYPDHNGQSQLALIFGQKAPSAETVHLERERHANVRRGDLSYPARAIRTSTFLYIRNLRPDRWPAGDPETYFAVGPFGDCDDGPTKQLILKHRDDPKFHRFFEMAFAKRPADELYDLKKDPDQLVNVAARPEFLNAKQELRDTLVRWMAATGDPRVSPADDRWDKFRYFGPSLNPRRPQ